KTPYTLPLNCWYPFDYKRPVVYEIVYFHQSVSALIDIFVNLNGATLAAGFLAYLSAECDVLVDLLKNLNNGSAMNEINLDTEMLKICVQYHKKIVEYSKLVESYFSKYLLIQFTSSCVSTALIMTSMSMNHDVNADFWFLSVLQLGVWADLYIYCWYGNEVTEKVSILNIRIFF
ncbi:odorant receptor 83a-like, partial [Anoplophora glabripennis]|uniref:odorant receptor 83a-like n=1 Tax=Anoplophora glabripennis TaxID=217634 RepID=UPI000C769C01